MMPSCAQDQPGVCVCAHIVSHAAVDQVSDKLHHAAVCVSVVERRRRDGALDDVHDDAAAEQGDRAALDKPERQTGETDR